MKNVKILISGAFILFAALIISCAYDNEEELYPKINNECDTANVSYEGHIASIIKTNCATCHGVSYQGTGAGVKLDDYSSLVKNFDMALGAIKHESKYSPMPKNSAKLSDCKIRMLELWKEAGFPN